MKTVSTHSPANGVDIEAQSPLGRLGAWCYRHRRLVLLAWVTVLVVVSFVGKAVGSDFKDNIDGGHTGSQQAALFLAHHFPAQAGASALVVFHTRGEVASPADRAVITQTLERVRAVPHVVGVASPFSPRHPGQVSADGHFAYGELQFNGDIDSIPNTDIETVVHLAQRADRAGVDAELLGTPIEKVEMPTFGTSEALGLLAAMVILLLAFGSVIAMALPIASAVVAVATMFGLLDLLSHALMVPTFGPELAALVGLGVGIDYALFIVTRYRQGLGEGLSPAQAVSRAMATSGRAAIFAGSTVVLSLLGLFLLGLPFIYGAALGAVFAVLLVMAASMTLLPAALGFAGPNIDRLRVGVRRHGQPAPGSAFWARWSRLVQRRPWTAGGAALLVLVVLALPFLSLHLAFTDAGTDPPSYTSRHAYDLLAQGFGPGAAGPLVIAVAEPAGAVSTAADADAVSRLAGRLALLRDVEAVSPPEYNPDRSAAVITVIPRTSPQDARTAALVHDIRDSVIPAVLAGTAVHAWVGGATAESVDTTNVISQHLPLVLSTVVLLGVLLLMVAFRSVVVPLASVVMTLVSTGAAYGVMVAVFQWGWLGGGIDNGTTAPVDPWIPVMLFALLFGLSMDYQVFLTARVKEAWSAGQSDADAVTSGLAATGRVVTSAAAIMVCVFGAFVLGDLRILKVFGFAMATAILLDATLVRMVLMPATLQVFGRANWWFPRRLAGVVPDFLSEPGEGARPGLARVRLGHAGRES